MAFSDKQITDNHARLVERNTIYRSFGYDVRESLTFVLARALPARGKVLEIGTGKGRLTVALAKNADNLTTVDIDPKEQRIGRMHALYEGVYPRVRFVLQNAEKLKWKKPTFDLVVSMNALHHIRRPERAVKEMIRVTRSDGKIVLSDFNTTGFRIMERIHEGENRVHERVEYDWAAIEELFRQAGWSTKRFEDCHQELLLAVGPKAGYIGPMADGG